MHFNDKNDKFNEKGMNMEHIYSFYPLDSQMISPNETPSRNPVRLSSLSSSENKTPSPDNNTNEEQSTCTANQIAPFVNKHSQMKQHEQKKDSLGNKRTFESIFIQTLMKERFSSTTKFYLSADQVVDIDYLKLLARNQDDAYVQDANKVCLFSGFKFINQVLHRMDTKYIEILLEDIVKPAQNVDQIVQLLLSLGDITLKQMADKLQVFWENIQNTMLTIKSISNDATFKAHLLEREAASDGLFEEVVSKLAQDSLIQYIYFKIDYENYTLYNSRTGYSPRLYELVAGNAYAFKQSLSKEGYYDPIFIKHRLNKCLENVIKFSQSQQTDKKQPKVAPPPPPQQQNTIRTLDGFLIPTFITRKIIQLNMPYDASNQLSFKANNFVLINTFELSKEEDVESQLRDLRSGKIYGEIINSELEGNEETLAKQFAQEQFLLKYYSDEIDTLEKKGNKWFKQCGTADIPSKKRKQS